MEVVLETWPIRSALRRASIPCPACGTLRMHCPGSLGSEIDPDSFDPAGAAVELAAQCCLRSADRRREVEAVVARVSDHCCLNRCCCLLRCTSLTRMAHLGKGHCCDKMKSSCNYWNLWDYIEHCHNSTCSDWPSR